MRTRRTTEEVRKAVRSIEMDRAMGEPLSALLKEHKVTASQYYKFRNDGVTMTIYGDEAPATTTFDDKDIIALVRSNLTQATKTKILSTLF